MTEAKVTLHVTLSTRVLPVYKKEPQRSSVPINSQTLTSPLSDRDLARVFGPALNTFWQ